MTTATVVEAMMLLRLWVTVSKAESGSCRDVVETWIHRGLRRHGDLASRTLASNHGYLEAFG
ncbi:unnamed protein product [Prunus armeniaca]